MGRKIKRLAILPLLVLGFAQAAEAYPISKGTNELRPLIGVTAAIEGQKTMFQMGLDWNYSLNGPLGFVLGYWAGFARDFIGMEFAVGVKYRFLRLHPRVAPHVGGGAGFTVAFDTRPGGETITGLGFRWGGGVDFFATPRIIPGMQIMFDIGPRFSPNVGLIASVQVTFGCSFLL